MTYGSNLHCKLNNTARLKAMKDEGTFCFLILGKDIDIDSKYAHALHRNLHVAPYVLVCFRIKLSTTVERAILYSISYEYGHAAAEGEWNLRMG
jgi:hypothetical protein